MKKPLRTLHFEPNFQKMNPNQEKIAEEMMNRMKLERGSTDWVKYRNMMNIDKHQMLLIVKGLKELKLIEEIFPESTSIRLTEIGFHWPGFSEQRKIVQEERSTQEQIAKLTLRKLKLEQFPTKFWWLLIIITALISILTTLINNRIESANKIKQTKEPIYYTDSIIN